MKIKINKDFLMYFTFFSIIVLLSIILKYDGNLFFYTYCISIIVFFFYLFINRNKDISRLLVFPIFLSIFQNVYFVFVANSINVTYLQIALICNFIISLTLILIYLKRIFRKGNYIFLLLILLTLYSLILFGIKKSVFLSALSSYRNVCAPFVFCLLGISLYKNKSVSKFMRYICIFALIVCLFGILDLSLFPDFWKNAGISTLWGKKGITVTSQGIPVNFYSAEIINGKQIRRMVSTFADPVNLGTFLFASFMCAWYLKKKILYLIIGFSCILTMSKGALLSFLVFLLIYTYYKNKKFIFPSILIVVCISIYFFIFSYNNSTGSLFLHLSGFINSFKIIYTEPLGRGLGNVGVLASLFSNELSSDILESGFGSIVGQLGLIGLIIYITFFVFLLRNGKKLISLDDKILYFSLLFSIFLNISFNEVALSPNSNSIYFIVLGFMIARQSPSARSVVN